MKPSDARAKKPTEHNSTDPTEPLIEVPDDFEGFEIARSKRTTTPDHERKVCPDCGSVDITRKSTRTTEMSQRKDGDWRCESCTYHFDVPDRAMPKTQQSLADFGGRRI